MNFCKMYTPLAYIAAAYIMSSLFYLLVTMNIGTPFKNAYTKYPELVEIKKKSSNTRRKIFFMGMGISVVVLFLLKPFKECN